MLCIQEMGAFSNQFNRVYMVCPPATFSHTNPLNISVIWTASKLSIPMLQTSNVAVLLIFFLLFPFLVVSKSHVLNLRVGTEGHMTHCCKRPIVLVQLINEYSQVTSQILMRDSWVEVTIHCRYFWVLISSNLINHIPGSCKQMAPFTFTFTFLVVVVWYFRYFPPPIKNIHKNSVCLVSGIHFTSDILIIKKKSIPSQYNWQTHGRWSWQKPHTQFIVLIILYFNYMLCKMQSHTVYTVYTLTTKNSRVHCGKKWKCIPQPNAGGLTSGSLKSSIKSVTWSAKLI